MELGFITIRFDTPQEQKFFEDNLSLSIWEHETWPEEDRHCMSWTEFDICGCEPHGIQDELNRVQALWEAQEE